MAPNKKRLQYSEASMSAACESVGKGMKLREAARNHGVPYPTLRARVNGRKSIRKVDRTVLGKDQETRLTEWLKESSRRGFGRTKNLLMSTVQECLNNQGETTPFKDNIPGQKWYRLFRERHKDQLSLRTPQALGSQRASVSEAKLVTWFKRAKEDIDQVDPNVLSCPDRIFNCDESGFQLGGGMKKVLAAKADKRVYQVTNDTHKQVTVLVCGNAVGELQAPLLIFPGQRFSYDPMEGFEEAHFAKSGNGWIDSEIFAKWLENVFCPAVAHLQKPVVLFADGHSTHLTLSIHDICKANSVILYQLPSHASHIVQPLDLTTFKNLKQAWYEEVMRYQEENSDTLSKQHFAKVFKKAWDRRGHDGDVLKSGFRASGIFPWDPNQFDRSKLAPHRMFETGEPNTSTSTLAAHEEATITEQTEELTIAGHTHELTTTEQADKQTTSGDELTITIIEQTDAPTTFGDIDEQIMEEQTELTHTTQMQTNETTIIEDSIEEDQTESNDMTIKTAFDKLLLLTAQAGTSGFVHYMACYDLNVRTDAPEQQLFSKLYSRVVNKLTILDKTDKSDNTVNKTNFNNLPLPSRWNRTKRTIVDPPKMVSSEEFRLFKENVEKKKKEVEEEKERKKKEKEEKRLKVQEEKQKKKREREERKKELEEQKRKEKERKEMEKLKKQNERKKKIAKKGRQQLDVTDSETDTENISLHDTDDDNDMDNLCAGCGSLTASSGSDVNDIWVSCGSCHRWFHVECTKDDTLLEKTEEELKCVPFTCTSCK